MSLHIRPATRADESAVARICLLTANAGTSAVDLHTFRDLPGSVYAVPYLHLSSCWGYVLVDERAGDEIVAGYVLGSHDVRAYEKEAEEKWWPPLRTKYPLPSNAPPETTDSDMYYLKFLQSPHITGQEIVDISPAFIHINLLPEYQRKGWGKKLIATACERFLKDDVQKLRVAIDSRNDEARKFYLKVGFEHVPSKEGEYYVLKAKDFLHNVSTKA